jgi:hypothetical protein
MYSAGSGEGLASSTRGFGRTSRHPGLPISHPYRVDLFIFKIRFLRPFAFLAVFPKSEAFSMCSMFTMWYKFKKRSFLSAFIGIYLWLN